MPCTAPFRVRLCPSLGQRCLGLGWVVFASEFLLANELIPNSILAKIVLRMDVKRLINRWDTRVYNYFRYL